MSLRISSVLITCFHDIQGEAKTGKRFSVVAEYVLRVLGLDYIADTFVGGPMLRGISGGQKKRLTTGEMLVG